MFRVLLLAPILTLCSCSHSTLLPSWQQDSGLDYHGTPHRIAQQSASPHLVARACYAAPELLEHLIAIQGDNAESVQGLVTMGDGTLALGLQDAKTGKWLETHQCGGQVLVAGTAGQAYRLMVRNLTPQPLDLAISIDGKDLMTGATASWSRSTLRIAGKQTLTLPALDSEAAPLLFRSILSAQALYATSPQGATGLIQVAAWLARDAPSLSGQRLRPGQVAPLGLLPIDRPEQYR